MRPLPPMLPVHTHLPADEEAVGGKRSASMGASPELLEQRGQAWQLFLERQRQGQAIANDMVLGHSDGLRGLRRPNDLR